jgi:hypothetical protein
MNELTISEKAESAIIEGDLKTLSPGERVQYYNRVCEAIGLLPTTRPFGYIILNGKLTLYALRGCTDQLRKIHQVSIRIDSITAADGMITAQVSGTDKTGRTDTEIGVVPIGKAQGEELANARMKALTKAKRRLTLSLCGLGMLDESEVSSIPGAQAFPPLAIESKPIESKPIEVPEPPPGNDPITPPILRQLQATIKSVADKLPANWREETLAKFQVKSSKDLTNRQAMTIINELQSYEGECNVE